MPITQDDNRVTDVLIDELDYNNIKTARYIKERSEVVFNVTGSSSYSPTTQTMANIVLNTIDTVLDQNTARLNFRVTNNALTHSLRLVSGAHCLISRVRVIGKNGVIIHDVQNYGRYCEMVNLLESKHHLDNYNSMSCAQSVNSIYNDSNKSSLSSLDILTKYSGVIRPRTDPSDGSNFVDVSIPLRVGLFTQSKFLLMRFLSPLTVEISFDNVAENCVVGNLPVQAASAGGGADINEYLYTPATPAVTHSTDYTISNINLSIDSLILDSGFLNTYDDLLLNKGKQIEYMLDNIYNQVQSTGNIPSLTVNISRSFRDLNTIFVTMYEANDAAKPWFKRSNSFTKYGVGGVKLNTSYQFSINGKLFPPNALGPQTSNQYYQLLKSVGLYNSSYHSLVINKLTYDDSNFIMSYDFDKALNVDESGVDMINSIMQLNLKGYNATPGTNYGNAAGLPAEVHITMVAKSKLIVKATSIEVLD
jgi:hypothetical protein